MERSQKTRALLQETALRMFGEGGYDSVTIEEIAAAAGVSHMTFYRHFPTKESVVLDDPYDPVIGAAIANQDPGLTVLERTRRGFTVVLAGMDRGDDATVLSRVRLAVHNRALRARLWENNQATENVIVENLVTTGAAEAEARVAAGAVLGAVTAALLEWARAEAPTGLSDYLLDALAIFEPSETVAP